MNRVDWVAEFANALLAVRPYFGPELASSIGRDRYDPSVSPEQSAHDYNVNVAVGDRRSRH